MDITIWLWPGLPLAWWLRNLALWLEMSFSSILWCILRQVLIYWGGKVYWVPFFKDRISITIGVSFSICILKLQVIWFTSVLHTTRGSYVIHHCVIAKWIYLSSGRNHKSPWSKDIDWILSWVEFHIPDNGQADFLIWQSLDQGEQSLHLEVFQDLYYSGGHQIWTFRVNNKLE